jgi:hypothetical protein
MNNAMLTDLQFSVLAARPEKYAAQPTISFRLGISDSSGVSIHSLALTTQIRIEPQRVTYTPEQQQQMFGLFSDLSRWADTLKPFLWTHVSSTVTSFKGRTEVDLPVPLSYDLEVAAGKYFHALRSAEIPLCFLFSGTVFANGPGGLSVQPISWDCEADFLLPGETWQAVMDNYFPGSGWLCLGRDTLDALERYKATNAHATWDATVKALLQETQGRVSA